MSLPTLAHPGQLLGPSAKYASGPGTYLSSSSIYASLAGPVNLTSPDTTKSSPAPSKTKPALSVLRLSSTSPVFSSTSNSNTLPTVHSIVLGRITRLQSRQVTVAILVVGEDVCADHFQGVIRKEDVRVTEKDKVKIEESFRVGDCVRGVVISLGDQSSYYLSTAKNELGVIMATSESGNAMHPVSWKEFRDPVTGERELRKVAKPF